MISSGRALAATCSRLTAITTVVGIRYRVNVCVTSEPSHRQLPAICRQTLSTTAQIALRLARSATWADRASDLTTSSTIVDAGLLLIGAKDAACMRACLSHLSA